MVAPNSPDRVDALGEELYLAWETPGAVAADQGRFIVFDVLSGDREIADTDLDATDRLAERRPDGVFWGTRIGFDAAYHVRMIGNLHDRRAR